MTSKRKYIPHLAEMKFRPSEDWLIEEAARMHFSAKIPEERKDKILFSDCVEGMCSMPENSVDLIIADPPFGLSYKGTEKYYNRKAENVVKGYREVEVGDYNEFSKSWIKELPRIMRDTASAYIISGYTNLVDVLTAINNAGLTLLNHIIWKYQFGVFATRKFVTSHYHVLFVVNNPQKYYFHRIEHYNLDVWEISRTYAAGKKKNGTKLPVELVEKMINFSSKPGDLVFDPFMGNGTTAEAAKLNYRHYFGYELNPKMTTIYDQLNDVELGEHYTSYTDRLPSPEELSTRNKDYMRAYQVYLKELKTKQVS